MRFRDVGREGYAGVSRAQQSEVGARAKGQRGRRSHLGGGETTSRSRLQGRVTGVQRRDRKLDKTDRSWEHSSFGGQLENKASSLLWYPGHVFSRPISSPRYLSVNAFLPKTDCCSHAAWSIAGIIL